MSETMLTPTGIKLYGRLMTELHLYCGPELQDIIARVNEAAEAAAARDGATPADVRSAVAESLRDLPAPPPDLRLGANKFLQQQLRSPDARFARIYSFSYDGHYYDMPRPVLLLVHGEGQPIRPPLGDRTTLDVSGVMAREWEFSNGDIKYWEYDKGDFSIRMDIESGPLDQILLEVHLRNAAALSSGMDLRNPDPRRR